MAKFVDQKYYGPEPVFQTTILDPNSGVYSNAFTWYMYTCSYEQKLGWLLDWMKENGYSKKQISEVAKRKHIPNSSLAVSRMLMNGWLLPSSFVENLKRKLDQYETPSDDEVVSAPVVSIQERIREKTRQIIGDFEEALDTFQDSYESTFNPYEYLQKNEISQIISNAIAEYYKRLANELADIKKIPDLQEGYKSVSKKQLKALSTFVNLIISDAERWASNKKKITVRKPRKAKEKPATQLVSKLIYAKEFPELKLASVDPSTIINAMALWTYNTKTRQLTVYNAIAGGLKVKGTTIKNFDEKTSVRKTLRKPSETINNVLNGGKVILRNLMDTLSTTALSLNGRINEQTILLKVVK